MGTKLYVGNLNYNTNEESLRALFASNGREVASVAVIMDRETGRSRGFAFVEMATAEFAAQALRELDGADLDGRALRISEAREREDRGPRSFGGPRPGGFSGGGGGAGFGAPRPAGGAGFGAPRPAGGAADDRRRGAPGGGAGRRDEGRRGGGGGRRRGGDDGDDW
ncbi:MAG: RNA-binding protein [Kofleriaceae bacterium]